MKEYKPLTAEEVAKMLEFERIAIDRYLDKTDFEISEWLPDEDARLYKEFVNRENQDEVYQLD